MSKIPLFLGIYNVFGLKIMIFQKKSLKITKIPKMAKMSTFGLSGKVPKSIKILVRLTEMSSGRD